MNPIRLELDNKETLAYSVTLCECYLARRGKIDTFFCFEIIKNTLIKLLERQKKNK